MTIQLTVLGLNRIGVSIGLALKGKADQITRIGSDVNLSAEKQALKMGAFDKVVHNIPAAVEGADIVVLCVPMDEVRKNLEIIAPVLKAGAVVFDTSPLAVTVSAWADHLFADERYLVSFTPSLNPARIASADDGIDQASEDLFQKSLIAISAPPTSHPDVIQLATDLASILGAKPYFADPYEIDGLIAMADLLPKLSAAALLRAVSRQASWREAGKLAGHVFYVASDPVEHLGEQKELGVTALLNGENTARVLDYLIEDLRAIQGMLRNQDNDELKKVLEEAGKVRQEWWQARQKADWEPKSDAPPIPTSGQMIGRLFGLGRLIKDKPAPKK